MYIGLSCNHISEIKGLSNNPILTDIDLSSNRIKVVKGFKDVKYLQDLDLTGNPIESIDIFDEINGISRLKINPLNIPEKLKPLVKQNFSYHSYDDFVLRRDLYSHNGITFNPEKEW